MLEKGEKFEKGGGSRRCRRHNPTQEMLMRSRRDIPAPDPVPGRTELIEAAFVEMDPICDGFCGALVELSREPDMREESYVALAVSALR